MYQLRGVPKPFESRESALSFLRGSPGYVRRREGYLRRFWPGLYAEVAPLTGLEKQKLEQRSARLRGVKPGRNVFDLIDVEDVTRPIAKGLVGQVPGLRVTDPAIKAGAGEIARRDRTGKVGKVAGQVEQAGLAGAAETVLERGLGSLAVGLAHPGKLPGDVKQIATGLGVLAVQAGIATYGDFEAAVTKGDLDFSRSRALGTQIVEATIADYRARYGKDWRKHAAEDPLFYWLDALGAAGGAVRGATIASKIRKGANPVAAVRQAYRPRTGTLREGNLVTHPVLSRNPAVAAGQRLGLGVVQRAERGDVDAVSGLVRRQAQRVVNAAASSRARKVGQEASAAQRTSDAVGRSSATALRRIGSRLTLAQQVALRVVHEQAPLDDVIASVRQWATEAKTPKQRKALTEMGTLRETAREYLTELDGVPVLRTDFVRPLVPRRGYKRGVDAETLAEVSRMVEEVAGDQPGGRERILLDMGVLTPEQVAYRKSAPGRVHLGARWIDDRELARQVEGQMAVDLQRSDLTLTGPDVPIERPRTLSEAKANLDTLDARVAKILRPIVDEMFPPAARQREQALRNVQPRGKRAQASVRTKLETEGVGGSSRSVLVDATRRVEERILELAENPDAHPTVRKLAQLIEEREQLRAAIGENFLDELGGTAGEAPFGTVTEIRSAPATRIVTSEVPGRIGLVGAEDFTGGLSRIPDVPTWKPEPAAAQRAKLETGGVPVAPGSVRHGYTGELRRSGNLREDTTRLVAESHREAQRFAEAQATHDLVTLAGNPIRFEGSVPVRVRALKPGESRQLKAVLAEAQRASESGARLSRAERQRYADAVTAWKRDLFPDDDEVAGVPFGEKVPGVVWVPRGLLRQMNAPVRRLVIPGRGLRAFDDLLAVMRFSILGAKGTGYIVPQLAGNGFMNLVQQGGKAFLNTVVRAPLMTRRYGARVSSAVDEIMGQGATRSLLEGVTDSPGSGKVSAATIWAGAKLNVFSDMAFRRSAFEYEARGRGFAGRGGMERLIFDKANSERLTEVANRARAAIGDYERMGPVERDVIRRAVFIYPWLKVASRYGVKFLVEHPVASNVAASQAEGAYGPAPRYASELVRVGGSEQRPTVINTAGANPLSTFAQVAETIGGTLAGDYPTFGELGGYLNPALEAGASAAFGRNLSTGQPAPAGLPGFARGLAERTAPATLRERLSEEQAGKVFPYSKAEAVAQYVGGSIAPRPVNAAVARERAERESLDKLPAGRRAYVRELREEQARARRANVELPREVVEALLVKNRLDTMLDAEERKARKRGRALTYRRRLEILGRFVGVDFAGLEVPEAQAEALYREYRRYAYPALEQWREMAAA